MTTIQEKFACLKNQHDKKIVFILAWTQTSGTRLHIIIFNKTNSEKCHWYVKPIILLMS